MLAQIQPDGKTLREHYEIAQAQGAHVEELEHAPDLPIELAHLWGYFAEIRRGRQTSMSGGMPISPQNINDWQSLRNVTLLPIEVDAIFRIDDVFMNLVVSNRAKEKK